MRDKVILGVTLSIVTLLTLAVYGIVDLSRGEGEVEAQREEATISGRHIFAQYCVQCHGPLGEGCIGPALNRVAWRPQIGGEDNPDYDEGAYEFIYKTVARGRPSTQPGMEMPAWHINEGGSLNDQQIEAVISFIQYGDWNRVIEDVPSATDMGEPLPAYPGFDDPEQLQRVKTLMLEKGCLNCHKLGKAGGFVAADLTDVGSRRATDWLHDWIKDPKLVPPEERGPNLWLIGPTPTIPPPAGVEPSTSPTPTAQVFQMNQTYMPTIDMTDEELQLMVDYLTRARTSTR